MKRIWIAVLLAVPLLTGCEAAVYRLLYHSLDTILYRAITRYIDPKPDQDRVLRAGIAATLAWHRKEELPRYLETLQGLRPRVAAGLGEADIAWLRARVERHAASLFDRTADDVAGFLLSLDDGQLDRMDREIGAHIDEIEKKGGDSADERSRKMVRSITWFMGFVYGSLTGPQKEAIVSSVSRLDDIEPLQIRMYRERRSEFIALMRGRPDKKKLKAYLRGIVLDSDRTCPDYLREASERRDRAMIEGFLRFDRELATPAQREQAVKKIDMLIRVVRELNAGA